MEINSTAKVEIYRKSCFDSLIHNISNGNSSSFCEVMFDEIMCWPQTKAGAISKQNCSNKYISSTVQGLATKKCTESGNWYISPETNATWANYSECGTFFYDVSPYSSPSDTQFIYDTWVPIIKKISQVGYIVSVVALIVAFLIFIYIKRLHCARNRLHQHLFISFIMRGVMYLLKDALFVNGTALPYETDYIDGQPDFARQNYSWECKAIVSMWQYFIISNYMLLLMEGTYLHNLMFLSLFSDKNEITIYYVLGWGLPVLFMIPWIILKIIYEDKYCWTQKINTYIAMLMEVPIAIAVVINFVLFVIIVRVLCIKLNSMYIQERKNKYRKLLKSTLILMPLFGIPYSISLIVYFYAIKNKTLEIIWLMFDQTFTAFQGFLAALVYCLFNSEVQIEIKRKYFSFKDRNNKKEFRRSRTISHTQQCSVPLTEDIAEIAQSLTRRDGICTKRLDTKF